MMKLTRDGKVPSSNSSFISLFLIISSRSIGCHASGWETDSKHVKDVLRDYVIRQITAKECLYLEM